MDSGYFTKPVFNRTDVICILGQRGSGKSTLGRSISRVWPNRIVIDRLREWTHDDIEIVTQDFGEFCNEVQKSVQENKRLNIAFQTDEDSERKDEEITQAIRLAYKFGKITGESCALIIEEAHHWASPVSINPWIFECITTGRHANLAIIASTQRPLGVSKHLLSAANHLFVGRLYETRDLGYLSEIMGSEVEKLPPLKNFQFLHFRPGEQSNIIASSDV